METKHTGFLKGRRELYENREKCPPDGDSPLLKFINTLHRRDAERKDYLKNYDCFLDWAYDNAIVEDKIYDTLCFESYCYCPEAEMIFNRIIGFRECLHDLVICLMDGVAPYPELVSTFILYFDEAKQHISININGYGLEEIWIETHEQIAFPFWKIINGAKGFLANIDGQSIKKCKCGNLFIDRSNARKRRWCNNATCGNAFWSKAYYKRKKEVLTAALN